MQQLPKIALICICLACGFAGCYQAPAAPAVQYSQEEADEISEALTNHDFDE